MIGLLPVLWSTGTGADVMKRIAAPMVGGLVTSFAAGAAGLPGDLRALEGARAPPSNPLEASLASRSLK